MATANDEQRDEIIRLISIGLGQQNAVGADQAAQTRLHASTILESYVEKCVDEVADEAISRAFSNTSLKQIIVDLNSSVNHNIITLEERVKKLSGLGQQVITGIISAVIITLIFFAIKRAGYPISLPN